jgi:hypothetical protein
MRIDNQRGTAEQHIKMGYRLEPHLQTAVDGKRGAALQAMINVVMFSNSHKHRKGSVA